VLNRFDKLEARVPKGIRLPLNVYWVALPRETLELPSGGDAQARLAVLPLANIGPHPIVTPRPLGGSLKSRTVLPRTCQKRSVGWPR
jgi:hypothetical protein